MYLDVHINLLIEIFLFIYMTLYNNFNVYPSTSNEYWILDNYICIIIGGIFDAAYPSQ